MKIENRVQKVCKHINEHLDEKHTLEELSQLAYCSKFHFNRVFSAFVGVSAMQYVLFARLKRASFRLAFETQITITEVALEAQFESVEGFSRAFSRTFGQTPSQFRSQPDWQNWHSKYSYQRPNNAEVSVDIELVNFQQRNIAFIAHKGSPNLVLNTAAKFIEWRKTTGLSPIASSETFGIPYSDPSDTPVDEFRFDIAGSHTGLVPDNEFGVKAGEIPAGRCAMAIHKGSHDNIGETIYNMYQNWLPESGEELRDFPCFFKYLNFIHEVNEYELLTEVYLPIK